MKLCTYLQINIWHMSGNKHDAYNISFGFVTHHSKDVIISNIQLINRCFLCFHHQWLVYSGWVMYRMCGKATFSLFCDRTNLHSIVLPCMCIYHFTLSVFINIIIHIIAQDMMKIFLLINSWYIITVKQKHLILNMLHSNILWILLRLHNW